MSLISELESQDKKGLFRSDDNIVCYPTGITVLDYANGYWTEVMNKDGELVRIPNIGIPGGSLVSIIGSTGGGKPVPDDAMIPTPSGLVRADSLQIGDYIFDRRGHKTKILAIYPQGVIDTYEFILQDGRIVRSGENHLWTTISLDGKLSSEPVTTKEIYEKYNNYHEDQFLPLDQYDALPMNEPVEYDEKPISIHPWVFGAFLSGGCLYSNELIYYTNREVVPRKIAEIMGWFVEKDSTDGVFSYYYFISKKTGKLIETKDVFTDYPEMIGLLDSDLYIPSSYLYNSVENRKLLLRGLMDNEGGISHLDFRIGYSTLSEKLRDDVVNLVRSLGYFAIKGESVMFDNRILYDIGIECSADEMKDLFSEGSFNHSDALKATRVLGDSWMIKSICILDVQKKEKSPMRCFVVDNDEHLFLTENYVVTHNSTLAEQIGWNIIKNFDDGLLIIVDCEKSAERERICNILGCPRDEPRIRIDKQKSSIDDVLESFDLLCKTKEAGGKRYMYEVHNRTFNGESFWTYVPTVYIIDSLPKFNCRDFNDKDLGGNTDSMRGAKDVTRFYTNIVDRAWQFNVIFIVINHIRPNLIMNPYASPPRGLMMINPQSETLPRGSVAQYYSSIYFRINSKKSAAYTIADDGFTGFKCDIQLAKSRTNIVGSTFPVTFNSDRGFDPIYSMYEFANSLGLIQGRNPYLTIKGFEERKFNRKEFVTLMTVDENFRMGVLTVLRPYYESLLSSRKEKVEEIKEIPDLSMTED